tara:strand:- start:109 stop:330 length:222 start_codon:yes stop_codon:yes gene_type:complete
MNEDQKMTNTENAELFEAKMRFAETEKQLNVLEEERDRLEADLDALTWEIEDKQDDLVVCAEAVDAAEEELEA